MPHPKSYAMTGRVALTAAVSAERAAEVTAVALSLGIPRHRLLVQALNIGVPLATEQFRQQAADQRPQG